MGYEADTYLSSGSNVLKVLEYNSGGNLYGINMLKVSRILNEAQGFRSLLNANPCIRGAFNDHGKIITLIDLNHFLGGPLTSMEGRYRIIICEFFGTMNGLLVDRVEAVHTLLWEKVISADEVFDNNQNPYVVSIVQPTEDKMLLLLDYETIIMELSPEKAVKEQEKTKKLAINGKGLRVLVADDSPSIRSLLKQELVDAGFTVLTARDGEDAWEILGRESIDLLVSDVEMPKMDGLALTKKVRDKYREPTLPIIVYSSIGDIGMKERARFLKAEHITKLQMDELLEKTVYLLKDKL